MRVVTIDHILLTRFNLPSGGQERLIRARDGWLQRRVDLFERYTIPSVISQSISGFHWIIYFDPESPRWLLDRLAPHVASGVYTPIFREAPTLLEVGEDMHQLSGARGSLLITTNLDNDDALASDFMERIQRLARPGKTQALFLEYGLIACGQHAYLRRDRDNAFCSVAEPWSKEPATAWRDWHTMLRQHMPVITSSGPPAWLQIFHGENVSNRVRGLLTDPSHHRSLFPGLIEGLISPPVSAVAWDFVVTAPLRTVRDCMRDVVKRVLLTFGGKQILDRVKLLLRVAFHRVM